MQSTSQDPGTPTDLDSALRMITTLKQEVLFLRRELDRMAKKMFGKKSEKLSPEQLQMVLSIVAELPEAAQDSEPIEADSGESLPVEPTPRKKSSGRKRLPRQLPRRRVVIDLPEAEKVCTCCAISMDCIGESVSEKLDYKPASLEVVEQVTLRYACPRCHDGVKAATPPPQAVEKGLAAEGLLAHVVTAKYVEHTPLYRLERSLARHGVAIARSTMCGFVEQVADALAPIGDEMKRQILSGDYLQTDDTPVVVLAFDGGSFKGRLWTYLDPLSRQVVFDATRTHERKWPEAFLESFKGFIQADAYTGYDAIFRDGRRREVACWAHARRRFKDALDAGEQKAASVLRHVQELYQIEREAHESPPLERQQVRCTRAKPVLDAIDRERQALMPHAPPKSLLGDALRYLDRQWSALQTYLEDGRLAIDNNAAERQLRAVAIGRKNWLFAGSEAGLRRAALMYSLAQSCALAGIDPFEYFRDVLLRVASHPHGRIAELTPRAWAAARTASSNAA